MLIEFSEKFISLCGLHGLREGEREKEREGGRERGGRQGRDNQSLSSNEFQLLLHVPGLLLSSVQC